MAATPATAITRTGRIRDIQASDHRPATIRPSAPMIWVTVIRVPAPAGDHPCATISQVGTKVHSMDWGMTSSMLTMWMRARKELSR